MCRHGKHSVGTNTKGPNFIGIGIPRRNLLQSIPIGIGEGCTIIGIHDSCHHGSRGIVTISITISITLTFTTAIIRFRYIILRRRHKVEMCRRRIGIIGIL